MNVQQYKDSHKELWAWENYYTTEDVENLQKRM